MINLLLRLYSKDRCLMGFVDYLFGERFVLKLVSGLPNVELHMREVAGNRSCRVGAASRNDEFHRFIPAVFVSACRYDFVRVFLRAMRKTHPPKNDRAADKIAYRLLLGLYFLSGTRGESMTLNPNCSLFRAIISLSTSWP